MRLFSFALLLCLAQGLDVRGNGDGGRNGGGGGGGGGGDADSSSTSTSSTSSTTSTSPTSVALAAAATGTTACNNSPDLCNRNYNNITHFGAHDIAFLRDSSTGYSTSGNQYYNATVALSAGVRLLQAQVHNSSGTLELCHSYCSLLDAGSLETFLSGVKSWMDDNTNEVVTLLLVNSDNMPVSDFASVFSSSGISSYGYTPSTTSGPMSTWPTLQTLISAGTRLVTFIAAIDYDSSYPYLLNEWDYMFETAYEVTSLSGFNCTLDRPTTLSSASAAISSGYLPLMNHFAYMQQAFGIQVPDVDDIETTNSPTTSLTGAIGTELDQCDSEWGQKPTFVLVDFWNVGPAIDAVDTINGITPVGRTNVTTAELTEASVTSGTAITKSNTIAALAAVCLMNIFLL